MPRSVLKRGSNTGVFLWILQNFKTLSTEHLYTTVSDYHNQKNIVEIVLLRADYIEIFHPLHQVEISSRLNSKLLFKTTLQLQVKISTRYTELKFQLGLANPRWNFNPGWKSDTTHAWTPYFFKKIKMATTQARFKWTDDKSINLIKCLQELDSSYVKSSFLNIDSFRWLQGFEVIIVIQNWFIEELQNFNFLLTEAIFVVTCFWHASGLTFLLSLHFPFTRDYISIRDEIFHIIEISTRDENQNYDFTKKGNSAT